MTDKPTIAPDAADAWSIAELDRFEKIRQAVRRARLTAASDEFGGPDPDMLLVTTLLTSQLESIRRTGAVIVTPSWIDGVIASEGLEL